MCAFLTHVLYAALNYRQFLIKYVWIIFFQKVSENSTLTGSVECNTFVTSSREPVWTIWIPLLTIHYTVVMYSPLNIIPGSTTNQAQNEFLSNVWHLDSDAPTQGNWYEQAVQPCSIWGLFGGVKVKYNAEKLYAL